MTKTPIVSNYQVPNGLQVYKFTSYAVDSIKHTVLLNLLSLLSALFSTVILQKISIKNTIYQKKKSVKS